MSMKYTRRLFALALAGTVWSTPDIWLRRHFEIAQVPAALKLWLHHDEAVEIYLNEQKIFESADWTMSYRAIELSGAARAALRPGINTIAVHCCQTAGRQYIDVGISTPQKP